MKKWWQFWRSDSNLQVIIKVSKNFSEDSKSKTLKRKMSTENYLAGLCAYIVESWHGFQLQAGGELWLATWKSFYRRLGFEWSVQRYPDLAVVSPRTWVCLDHTSRWLIIKIDEEWYFFMVNYPSQRAFFEITGQDRSDLRAIATQHQGSNRKISDNLRHALSLVIQAQS